MFSIDRVVARVNQEIQCLTENMRCRTGEMLGREEGRVVSIVVWVNRRCIIINSKDEYQMNWFAGKKKLEGPFVLRLGDYVVYLNDDPTILRWITNFYERELHD